MVDVLMEYTTVNGIMYKDYDIAYIKSQVPVECVLYARFNPLHIQDANAIEVRLEEGEGLLLGHVDKGCAARVAALGIDNAELELQMSTTDIVSHKNAGTLPIKLTCVRLRGPAPATAAITQQPVMPALAPQVQVSSTPGCLPACLHPHRVSMDGGAD
jgi:hypothetical protein